VWYDDITDYPSEIRRLHESEYHGVDYTFVNVELNGAQIMMFDYEALVFPQWDPDFHIGSYKGHMYHFEGFIHSFYYNIAPYIGACNFLVDTACAEGCGICPDFVTIEPADGTGFCLSGCSYN